MSHPSLPVKPQTDTTVPTGPRADRSPPISDHHLSDLEELSADDLRALLKTTKMRTIVEKHLGEYEITTNQLSTELRAAHRDYTNVLNRLRDVGTANNTPDPKALDEHYTFARRVRNYLLATPHISPDYPLSRVRSEFTKTLEASINEMIRRIDSKTHPHAGAVLRSHWTTFEDWWIKFEPREDGMDMQSPREKERVEIALKAKELAAEDEKVPKKRKVDIEDDDPKKKPKKESKGRGSGR